MDQPPAIKLVPTGPPGRSSRKARAFTAEIQHLRAQGFTFEAIRGALAAAGVQVSNRTVQREAVRSVEMGPRYTASPDDQPLPAPDRAAQPTDPAVSTPTACAPIRQSGREFAEAFVLAHPTNPLLKRKESP